MYRYIGMEDVVANALIELIEKKESKKVSMNQLIEYGNVVVHNLKSNGEKAILLVSRDYTDEFIRDYSNYFHLEFQDEEQFIELKEGFTAEDLRATFRAYLTISVLKAFIDKDSLSVLGV